MFTGQFAGTPSKKQFGLGIPFNNDAVLVNNNNGIRSSIKNGLYLTFSFLYLLCPVIDFNSHFFYLVAEIFCKFRLPGLLFFQPYKFRYIFYPVNNIHDFIFIIQHRFIQRTPEPFFKTAIVSAYIIFLYSHWMFCFVWQ